MSKRGVFGAMASIVFVGLVWACTGEDPDLAPAKEDGGEPDTTSRDDAVAADGNGDAADAGPLLCANGCRGCVVYVSPDGKDSNDGCTTATPKRSIGAALAKVKDATLTDHSIHVCDGSYAEALVIDHGPLKLLGAFDCASWTRRQVNARADKDGLRTRVTNPGTAGHAVTFRGASITRDVLFEGFYVEGARATTGNVSGIFVEGASPTIRNNYVFGGDSEESTTAGISISAGSPDIGENRISGGLAQGKAPSKTAYSTGISIFNPSSFTGTSTPSIHDNVLEAGKATTSNTSLRIASAAVAVGGPNVAMTGPNAFARNSLFGGSGSENTSPAPARGRTTVGLRLGATGDVEVIGNIINGGSAGNGAVGQAGVVLAGGSGSTLRLSGNRIFGGSRVSGANEPADAVAGIAVETVAVRVEIIQNLVHAGAAPTGTSAVGISIAPTVAGATVLVQHNVVHAPGGGGSPAIFLGPNATQAHLAFNVFPANQPGGTVIASEPCLAPSSLPTLASNTFFEKSELLARRALDGGSPASSCGGESSFSDPGALGSQAASWQGNVRVGPNGCDAGCETLCDGGVAGCLPEVFAAWTQDGVTELLDGGWRLKTRRCSITKGATGIVGDGGAVAPPASDHYGKPRTEPRSMGAEEIDDPCTP